MPVAGNGNTGQFSINGQRESANGFCLNGASVQETSGQQAGVVPNLDSIAEFRILTSNAEAEYGGYSGGLINVITKSGGNEFHGSLFEFLRNTNLDARGFFSPGRSGFQQNQFGGTVGGPIRKNKLFFFGDYQGQRTIQGLETGLVRVPSLANRGGNFSDAANTLTGQVNGSYVAQTLTSRLGYGVNDGEPYYTPNCTSTSQCVFPNATIPHRAFSAPATHLLNTYQLPARDRGCFRRARRRIGLPMTWAPCASISTPKSAGRFPHYFADSTTKQSLPERSRRSDSARLQRALERPYSTDCSESHHQVRFDCR